MLQGGCQTAVLITWMKKVAVLGGSFSYVNEMLCVLLLNVMLAMNRHLVSYLFFIVTLSRESRD